MATSQQNQEQIKKKLESYLNKLKGEDQSKIRELIEEFGSNTEKVFQIMLDAQFSLFELAEAITRREIEIDPIAYVKREGNQEEECQLSDEYDDPDDSHLRDTRLR